MTRKVFVLLMCGVVLLCLAFTAGQLAAQRFGREEPAVLRGQVGRFVLVRAVGDVVILLDTATGDLYQADLKRDVKKYSERHRPGFPPADKKTVDKDKAAVDKVIDKGVEIPEKKE